MGYRLIFTGVSEKEERLAKKEHRYSQEKVKISPPLNKEIMAKIGSMTGSVCDSKCIGAYVEKVSAGTITIGSCCDTCKRDLARQIFSVLGTKAVVTVIIS